MLNNPENPEVLTRVNQYTVGEWPDEPAACRELDRRLEEADCFKVYREVEGFYTQPRVDVEDRQPRIDRLLVPNKRLQEAGWRLGAIGIEAKCSGKKIGPIICQALDYARAVFTLPAGGVRVSVNWVFIWPLGTVYGDVASMMANYCIGSVFGNAYHLLSFASCGSHILNVNNDKTLSVKHATSGRKAGSR